MLENPSSEHLRDLPSEPDAKPISKTAKTKQATVVYAPNHDIDLWLDLNAPLTFDQLADLRYCLYHKCSRGAFKVERILGDKFILEGRSSSVGFFSNKARHYLLWRLRQWGWANDWINAIPRKKVEAEQ